jgi:integrase/recombinase XerD
MQNPWRLVEDFCKDCELRGMTSESIRRYRFSLLIFAKFLLKRGVDPGNADKHVLKVFLQYLLHERKVKHKTVENYFSALSAFYDYLAFEGLMGANAALLFRKRYLRRYKNGYDDPERKLLSVEEMSKLIG